MFGCCSSLPDGSEEWVDESSSSEVVILDEERYYQGKKKNEVTSFHRKVPNATSEYGLWRKGLNSEEMEEILATFKKEGYFSWKLILSFNKLDSLPPKVLSFHQLRELSLADNCLKSLPSLTNLGSLEKLYVKNNPELKHLPPLPKSLKRLYASNCGLDERLFDSISECWQLTHLSLLNNQIRKIPAFLNESNPRLRELDLSQNLLWRVPYHLSRLKDIECLFLRQNPLPPTLNRNVVIKLPQFFASVKCFETLLVVFMCWSRLRTEKSATCNLGSIPRDLLWLICPT
jgi:hypothetical protein